MNLIKADFKKITFLPAFRNLLMATILLSVLFAAIFLYSIGITQGRALTDLSFMEMIDILFLGIDVTAIMLIIFTAMFISKNLASGAVHTSLAITPVRGKFYLTRILFLTVLSFLISIIVISLLLLLSYTTILVIDLGGTGSLGKGVFMKIIGSVLMVCFYSILSAAGAFYIQSTAGGITFALAIMFLPALFGMFPAEISDPLLAIFPENALSYFIDINAASGSITLSVVILLAWIAIFSSIGFWKFKNIDY